MKKVLKHFLYIASLQLSLAFGIVSNAKGNDPLSGAVGATIGEIKYFSDNNRKKESTESIAFTNVKTMTKDMQSYLEQSTNDPNEPDIFKFYHYFDNA